MDVWADLLVVFLAVFGFVGWNVFKTYKASQMADIQRMQQKERENAALKTAKDIVENKALKDIANGWTSRYPGNSDKLPGDDNK